MTFVIGSGCIDHQDGSCIDVCPVDCIYEGVRKNYINPVECIDCGACELVCPEVAIFPARSVRSDVERQTFLEDNALFFTDVLTGRAEPVGNPGGARKVGSVDVDTQLVADWPHQ